MKLNCKRIDFTYIPGEEIFNFPEESGLPFLFDVEEELTGDPAAMDAVGEMHAGLTIPMHYGTFDLSDEPLHDPPKVFATEAKKRKISVEIPYLGEIVKLKKQK